MGKIGLIAALPDELAQVVSILNPENVSVQRVGVIDFTIFEIYGHTIYAALSGVGKVNAALAATTMLLTFDPDFVINVGVAGGFDMKQDPLDYVIPTEFVYTDVDTTALGREPGQVWDEPARFKASEKLIDVVKSFADSLDHPVHYGLLGSGDQFVSSSELIDKIRRCFPDVIAVEMEGAAIAHVCYRFDKPVFALRSLSDIPGKQKDNNDKFINTLELASRATAHLVAKLVEKLKE